MPRRCGAYRVGRAASVAMGCVVALLAGRPAAARAQAATNKPCDLYTDSTPTSHSNSVRLPSGKYNTFFAGGVIAHCRNEGNTLKSDSAEYYNEAGILYLIGHVHYTEPRVSVDARHGTYFVGEGRLLADTNVYAVMSTGTTLRGPHADYLRAIPGVRPRAQLTAVGRPHIHLVQRDSATSVPDTAGIDADRVYMDGDSLVYASHNVVIQRTDLTATGDSAALDQGRGFARLLRSPKIVGHDLKHPFTLRGDIIDLFAVNHVLTRVISMQHADGVSKDMHLTSDTIDMRFDNKVLSRSYAWGASRAHATTPDRDILADSIDVIMPQQQIHQVRAVRKAYATSVPDTAHFKSTERDWMKGDTIISYFDTTLARARPPASTTSAARTGSGGPGAPPPAQDSQPELKTVVAQGDARALYQMAPRDKTQTKPALNYVRGRVITIQLQHRQVQTVTVTDSAAGVYLEPQSDTVRIDSARRAKAAADTIPGYLRKKKKGGKGSGRGGAGETAPPDSAAPFIPSDSTSPKSSSGRSSSAELPAGARHPAEPPVEVPT